MNTLISADNTWALWAIIVGWAAASIYLEQKYAWAGKVSGAIIALIGALALSNFKIIPTDAPVYDVVWGYVVPLAIPLLLIQGNIKKIWSESGKLLLIFVVGSIGTTVGSILAYYILRNYIPNLNGVAGMMTGSYIGGSVNFAALAGALDVPGEVVSATTVADNLLMALYFFVLIAIPSIGFFRKHFKHPFVDRVESIGISKEDETLAAAYWGRKEISLKDIAFACATSFIIVALSDAIALFLGGIIPTSNTALKMLNILFSNKYLIITTLSMCAATFAPHVFGEIKGCQEIGTFLIYLFFFVIGVPASIMLIVMNSPLLLVFCLIMVIINMLFVFLFAKLFKFNLEDAILASNANIGGPTTAVAMAISKGWIELVGPIMLVGTLGYVIGTYFGLFVGNLLV